MSTSKTMKAMKFFKPFDGSKAHQCNQENVLYVQSTLFRFGQSEEEPQQKEMWHCMFTTERFIICKENNDGMIIDRKQLNYQNIKYFKLKKNKRFKKSNLPSIKVYITEKIIENIESMVEDDRNRPKVVFSFKNNELKDNFYKKMSEIIGYKKKNNHFSETETETEYNPTIFNYDLYNTLAIIIKRQDIYNEYLSMKGNDSLEPFRFLNVVKYQAQEMVNISSNNGTGACAYVNKLSSDDIKHIYAYYKTKQDNFEIRNNRKQWFINCYIATLLFNEYFPVQGLSNISDEIKWCWIKQVCRSSIYFINDYEMNEKCIYLIDTLIKKCFNTKYIKPRDTFFHEKDYQNLQILLYLVTNYISTNHLKKMNFRFKQMIPLLINNKQHEYFINLISIPEILDGFKESDIYQCIMIINNEKDIICQELIKMLLHNINKNVNKIYPPNVLYLQEVIKNGDNDDEANVLMKLKINLIINPKLLNKIYPNLYDGMTPLQYAKKEKKNIWPNVISFLQEKQEGYIYTVSPRAPLSAPLSAPLTPLTKGKGKKEKEKKEKKSKITPTPTSVSASVAPSWGFSNFVGHCFSFTQFTTTDPSKSKSTSTSTSPATSPSSSTARKNNNNNNKDLQRRLQSYITTLEKFKTKTRNFENKISKLNKAMDKQNEKIIELKLENKMLKNVFMNNEFKHNETNGCNDGNENDDDDDDDDVDTILITQKKWKNWSYLEIIYWICSLQNGRFKKYKNTLKVNLKLRNIKGMHLCRMDKSDLTYFYGIVDFGDVSDLYQEIENLVDNNN